MLHMNQSLFEFTIISVCVVDCMCVGVAVFCHRVCE